MRNDQHCPSFDGGRFPLALIQWLESASIGACRFCGDKALLPASFGWPPSGAGQKGRSRFMTSTLRQEVFSECLLTSRRTPCNVDSYWPRWDAWPQLAPVMHTLSRANNHRARSNKPPAPRGRRTIRRSAEFRKPEVSMALPPARAGAALEPPHRLARFTSASRSARCRDTSTHAGRYDCTSSWLTRTIG